MAVSTQRILLIFVFFNLVIGTVSTLYMEENDINELEMDKLIEIGETSEVEFESDSAIWGSVKTTEERINEDSIGSPITWGKVIIDVFKNAVNPYSIKTSDGTSTLEQSIILMLLVFRSALMILLVLEIILLIKNKKST